MMEASEQESVAVDFFTGLSEAIGLETSVSATLTDDNVLQIDVDGSEVGLLIGPGLHTLDALQEIARHVVQREADDREYGKVQVDVAGVRVTRRAALEAFVGQCEAALNVCLRVRDCVTGSGGCASGTQQPRRREGERASGLRERH